MPTRFADVLPLKKTGAPLSPPAAPAKTRSWHSIVMLFGTLASTQVWLTGPIVPPVVAPTLKRKEPEVGVPNRKLVRDRRGWAALTCGVPSITPQKSGLAICGPAESAAES